MTLERSTRNDDVCSCELCLALLELAESASPRATMRLVAGGRRDDDQAKTSPAGDLFGTSEFCGAEDPERPGWRCVRAPNHRAPTHLYAKGIQMGTVPREALER